MPPDRRMLPVARVEAVGAYTLLRAAKRRRRRGRAGAVLHAPGRPRAERRVPAAGAVGGLGGRGRDRLPARRARRRHRARWPGPRRCPCWGRWATASSCATGPRSWSAAASARPSCRGWCATCRGPVTTAARVPQQRARRVRRADRPRRDRRAGADARDRAAGPAAAGRRRPSTPAGPIRCCTPWPRSAPSTTCRCQLAMEAAMACGFGACYGCAVEIDGELEAALRRGAGAGGGTGAGAARCEPATRFCGIDARPSAAERLGHAGRARGGHPRRGRVRHQDGHAATRARATRRRGSPRRRRAWSTRSASRTRASSGSATSTCRGWPSWACR